MTIEGDYRVDSRGFAPKMIIKNLEVSEVARAARPKKKAALQFTELDAKSALSKVVPDIHTEWNDSNISSGTSVMRTGQLSASTSLDDLGEIARENLKSELHYYFERNLQKEAKISATTGAFDPADIKTVVKYLMDGNDYNPSFKPASDTFRKGLKKTLKALGSEEDILTLISSSKIPNDEDEPSEELRKVYAVLFLNTSTLEAVRIFVVEGKM